MSPVTLVGHNLAMLVAATELVRQGVAVRLCTDGKALGAHFAGLVAQGHVFDIGMVMLEKCGHPQPSDALSTYRPEIRNDWTRFGHLAAAWLERQAPLVRVPTPECHVQGRTGPDYLIANRLDMLSGLRVGQQLVPPPPNLSPDDPRHPRHKVSSPAYDTLSYQEAAALCHGDAFHALAIEPFVRKLLGQGSDRFLARYHRAAWAPLFYPETLRAALHGDATGLAEYPFWMPASGCVGDIVSRLRADLLAHPLLSLQAEALTSLTPEGQRPQALGLPAERCSALLQAADAVPARAPAPAPPPAASVSVAFCLVPEEAITRSTGCLMVVDEAYAAYRLTDQDHLAGRAAPLHRVTIEAGPDRLAAQHPGATPAQALSLELSRLLGVDNPADVQVAQCITARHALAWPSTEAIQAGQQTYRCLSEALPGVALTGTLLGYGVASFNDQIVQGLKLAEEFA
ncbi:MAG: hypothetical protein LW854_13330 [Rubrivivax sp.]|jgi:hypothetical protein|nr:hypothetical protein [Rubrivivax sp.]